MSDVNIPLLRKAVEWVEQQEALPEARREWDQAGWLTPASERQSLVAPECGTAYCVAGYIGQTLNEAYAHAEGNRVDGVHVADYAADALGISPGWEEDDHLFGSANTAADIRRIAEELAGERL